MIANPAVRQAAGRTAKKRIEEQYQWEKIARDIEKTYIQLMGWGQVDAPAKKPNASVAAIGESAGPIQRAG